MNRVLAALAGLFVLLASTSASAGGMYLTDRGVVPMGRGFAMVAGTRDPQALWYNPAGLAFAGRQFLFDASMTTLNAHFARVDGGGNQWPSIRLGQKYIPIPMMAYSHPLNDELTLGVGVFAPNAILPNYPYNVNPTTGVPCSDPSQSDCSPAPTRYSVYNFNGSMLAHLAAALAYQPIPGLSLSLGGQMMVGTLQAEMAMSACDGAICQYPEDPEFDGTVSMRVFPIISPGLMGGFIYDINHVVRIGASFLWWLNAINSPAKLQVRLPSASMFNGAYLDGNKARVKVPFPLTLRGGVEVTPVQNLHIETALVWEQWSRQQYMSIDPKNIWIRNVTAIGDYQVGPMSIPRMMNNVFSVRVGFDYTVIPGLVVRAGYNYANSSFKNQYLTPLTLDARKHIMGLGASYLVHDGIWLDVSYAHVFMSDPTVTNSQVYQPNAIRPTDTATTTPLGNGKYTMEANMFGIGIRLEIDNFLQARAAERQARIRASMRNPPPERTDHPNDTMGPTMEEGLDNEMRFDLNESAPEAPATDSTPPPST